MQVLISGPGSLRQLSSLLAQRQSKKILWVVGRHLLNNVGFRELKNSLAVPQQMIHPPEGVLQVEEIPVFERLETVVAIGGGKTMDYAKGILSKRPEGVFFVAVPTTAGSGSEATPIAVFYNGRGKISLDTPALLPAVAVLDPTLLQPLPPLQRAISGADALAQCIESVWSKASNALAENYSLTGLELLWQYFSGFVQQTNDGAPEKMLWASHLAGKAIALTRTTGPHALSYYLTANFDVPHGQAVALTLPLFFYYNHQQRTATQLEKLFAVMKVTNAEEAFLQCRVLFRSAGLAVSLAELGLANLDFDHWLASVNHQRFSNNPVEFNAAALKDLFRRYL